MSMAWIRKNYRVPAKRGGRVLYTGRGRVEYGTIKSARCGRLNVLLDGEKYTVPLHPTWGLSYLMNTEQERADFEAWAQNSFELHRHSAGEYSSKFTQTAWAAWQSRAALQSQGREVEQLRQDAERYRWLRDANINTLPYGDHGIGPEFPCGDDLDDTIDAAMSKEGK